MEEKIWSGYIVTDSHNLLRFNRILRRESGSDQVLLSRHL